MSFSEGLFRFTLGAIHYSSLLKLYFVSALSWMWNSVLYVAKHKGSKLEAIQNDARTLRKLPVHVAVIVNNNTVDIDGIARLAVWAHASGIATVSLYDPDGKHQPTIYCALVCILLDVIIYM